MAPSSRPTFLSFSAAPLEDEDGELNAESIPDVVFFSLKQYASTPIRGVDHRVPALQALGHFFARYKDKIMRTSIRELLRDALLTGSTELQLAAVSVIEVSAFVEWSFEISLTQWPVHVRSL